MGPWVVGTLQGNGAAQAFGPAELAEAVRSAVVDAVVDGALTLNI